MKLKVNLIKDIIRKILKKISFPYAFLISSLLSESKLKKFVYSEYFNSAFDKKFYLNKYILDINYYSLPNTNKRKIIHASMGDDKQGVYWARYYRSLGFPDKFTSRNLAYRYLEEFIEENKNKKYIIHQVCASSGREINFFSKLSKSIKFQASDITKAIANDIKEYYPNLDCYEFDICDKSQINKFAECSDLILAFGGLQYLIPEDLELFFNICNKKNTELIISQPIDAKLSPYTLEKSIPRGNFSWSHPYLKISEKYKFKSKYVNTVYLNESPWAQTFTAHFYP